jgi:hypothetical protein
MTSIRILVFLLISAGVVQLAAAWQEITRTLTLIHDDLRVDVTVPHLWQPVESEDSARAEILSEKELDLSELDVQRLVIQVDDLDSPFGPLPDNDRVSIFMEQLALTMPTREEFPTEIVTEVVRFRWDGFPAALFLSYTPGDEDNPAYYARWLGVEIPDGQVVLIEQATTLPDGVPPAGDTLDTMDNILTTLHINSTLLDATQPIAALKRVTDPFSLIGPVVASLRLSDGPEVRLSAPPGWQRRVVTESTSVPATYFFEADLRAVEEGSNPPGAFILITLLGESPLRERLGVQELPPSGSLALAYLNALLAGRSSDLTLGNPIEFEWGEEHYAVLLPGEFSGDEALQLLILEIDGRLLSVAVYAPLDDWPDIAPIWENVLGSLRVDGELLPTEPLQDALSQISEEDD